MQNDAAGKFGDLHVPQKCSESNRIIGAKDHASIQMNVAEVDRVTGRPPLELLSFSCKALKSLPQQTAEPPTAVVSSPSSYLQSLLQPNATSQQFPTNTALMTLSSDICCQIQRFAFLSTTN
ncbi:hypothetical protein A6R68_04164 [Neotoma lepida]|uniref:40S ribosomal protein S21 n=1 Tax=Neotoma lepida TaxID=56216 RepID=A0A1A6GM59_NEOLE|nr:hypothetical protein A6R68_04164 [Neotoma lepida]